MHGKKTYFQLPFHRKCQFIYMIRRRLYEANTKEEQNVAIPKWLIKMVTNFELQYGYKNFAALFLGSLLIMIDYADNEEIVCLLDEIHNNQLHLTILELEKDLALLGLVIFEEDKVD